ncbi:MAG: protein kinase domain-containing protein [Thiobacillus sp.]
MSIPTKIGRYEVVATLGQGAMGTVYKAVDPVIERTVAIKTINLNLSKQELAGFEERFYREAKSAGRLNHPNIITIYDVGETDGIAYIAMEYLEGESLRDMLDSGVVLPAEIIAELVSRIAAALDYAHRHHIVHRDIKPANIMVTASRDVKIMDFGIAQIPTASRTQLGTVLGSPKYMAPEQVAGKATDSRTDIFALGVVLYEMLTGKPPFDGDNLSAIMYKILNEAPAPPSALNPRVPAAFDGVVARALAKRPEDRHPSAGEFARALRALAGLPEAGDRAAPAVPAKAKGGAVSAPADPQAATVFLPPRTAGKSATAVAAVGGARQTRRWLALALVPVIALAAYLLLARSPQPVPGVARQAPASTASIAPPAEPAAPPATGARPSREATAAPPRPAAPSDAARPAPPVALPSPPVVAAPAQATVTVGVHPWGELYVDDQRIGVSPPLTRFRLDPGRHRIEIRNPGFAPYSDTVNLAPGQSIKIKHKFR